MRWKPLSPGEKRPRGRVLVTCWPKASERNADAMMAALTNEEYTPQPRVVVAEYIRGAWREPGWPRAQLYGVRAWQPLPSPYEEG